MLGVLSERSDFRTHYTSGTEQFERVWDWRVPRLVHNVSAILRHPVLFSTVAIVTQQKFRPQRSN